VQDPASGFAPLLGQGAEISKPVDRFLCLFLVENFHFFLLSLRVVGALSAVPVDYINIVAADEPVAMIAFDFQPRLMLSEHVRQCPSGSVPVMGAVRLGALRTLSRAAVTRAFSVLI